ncbi:MAG: pyridoxamine 5'-phosphate oxidase family protein [Legionella sp.]|uniref:pyridoxine/pyridoxamine 5'-phosphate oxidase n=1 Tax=Legionella sp. TaxID=459 RepID=UPI0039E47C43
MIQANPFIELSLWLANEREEGASNPNYAVLSSTSIEGLARSRVVAIREITDEAVLFFTQKSTRKVRDLLHNPHVSLVFWLELQQKEVIIEGNAIALTALENKHYWEHYPRWAQIHFLSYAPISAQVISSKDTLEKKREEIERKFVNQELPISPEYCGFKIVPQRIVFYAYRTDELSDVWEYTLENKSWKIQRLSP